MSEYPYNLIFDIFENEIENTDAYPSDITQTMNYLVECLPPQEREAIIMHYRQGETNLEVIRHVAKIYKWDSVMEIIAKGVTMLRNDRTYYLIHHGIDNIIDEHLKANIPTARKIFAEKMGDIYTKHGSKYDLAAGIMSSVMRDTLKSLGFGDGVQFAEKLEYDELHGRSK